MIWVASISGSKRMRCAASSAVSGCAVEGLHGEHPAVGEVAVVRDGEDLGAGAVLEVRHVGPEVLGVLAVVLREGQRLVGDAGVAAEEHVAVQVVAADRGPLEADDRGEGPGVVVAVGERGVGLPGVADRALALDRRLVAGERADDLHGGGEDRVDVAAGQLGVPALARLGREHLGVAGEQLRHQAVHLGVVGDDEEVERAAELGAQAAGRDRPPRRGRSGRRPPARAGPSCRRRPRSRCAGGCRRTAAGSGSCARRRARTPA